jgi:hypothetical protein
LRLTVDLNNILEIIKVILIDGQNLGPLSTEEECGKIKKKRFLEKKIYSEKFSEYVEEVTNKIENI